MINFEIPKQVGYAIETLNQNGYTAYLVGGCVRDFLMGKTPHDYDITTSAMPSEVMEVFKDEKCIPTGLKHGTVTVIIGSIPLEITTYRTESTYSDNRHPDKVIFTPNLSEDIARRDFTINAIAYHPKEGLIDYYNGFSDIQNKIIRCVGDPEERFTEDALRIFRALRFSSQLGFEIEAKTKEALFNHKELLKKVSAERLCVEFVKMLCGDAAGKILVDYTEIIGVIIPEVLPMKGFDQKNKHHIYDVLTHTAVAVDNVPKEKILRLSMFLHDFGKPHCFSLDERGVGHFYGHQNISAKMSYKILSRLKFDNDTKSKVSILVKWHDVPIDNTPKSIKKMLNKISPELFFPLLDIKRGDTIAHRDDYGPRLKQLDEIEQTAKELIENESCFSLKNLAINGDDIIAMGIKGVEVGKLLNKALDSVINETVPNEKSALLEFINNIFIKS